MRNTAKSSSPSSSVPSNAFSASFLLEATRLGDEPFVSPPVLPGGAFWAGPWEVEEVHLRHGTAWGVVRRGESLAAGAEAVALTRHRPDALLVAAVLPALAVPNHLAIGEKAKRLGVPLHDGGRCVGHLARHEPRIAEHLHVVRTLVARPESFALAVEAAGREEIPVLGRALARRLETT